MRSPCENSTEYSGSIPGEDVHVTFYLFFIFLKALLWSRASLYSVQGRLNGSLTR